VEVTRFVQTRAPGPRLHPLHATPSPSVAAAVCLILAQASVAEPV